MDAALQGVAEELETFALKRDRILTVAGTVAFVVFGIFLAQEVSAKVEGVALVAPPLANMMLAIALVAAFAAFAASRKKDHLVELEKRGKSLSTIRDPALAPVREVLKQCSNGDTAIFDRHDVQVDRPVFTSPHAVILFLPLQRHRNYRLPNAERPLDEQLKAVRAVQLKAAIVGFARSGASARNAFLEDITSLWCVPRLQTVVDHWDDPTKGAKFKAALYEARELATEVPSMNDSDLARQVSVRLEARGMKVGLSGSTSTEWLEQVLGGTGDYGWIRDYLSGNDDALPARRARKRRS